MIKRTIEISHQPSYVSASHGQLLIQPFDQDKSAERSIPAEDIGLMMVDQPRSTFSHHALATLMDQGAAFVVCGRDHMPLGMMLPISSHHEVVWRIQDQISAGKPTCKRIWQQLVQAKIRAQANLLSPAGATRKQLLCLAQEVKSGDSTNAEAQAARLYWPAWGNSGDDPRWASSASAQAGMINLDDKPFRRDTDGKDPINAMLNYGYGVLRAAVARSLVSAGLFPAIGLHHHNRSNSFCLADDLMEPLRPLVDSRVSMLRIQGHQSLDRSVKATLLTVLIAPVRIRDQHGPLMVSLHHMTASLVRCYQGQTRKLEVPVPVDAEYHNSAGGSVVEK